MKTNRLLILNGSTRKKGTSFSFARTIKRLSDDAGYKATIIHVIDYFDGKEELQHLKELILESDYIAIVAPVYTDTLPYHNLWLLEELANDINIDLKGKGFFAVGQCGFPDITRIEPLLDTCKYFAQEVEMKWLGGLAYGGGSMLDGAFLEDLGKKGQKITLGFKTALHDIFRGKHISNKSQDLLTVEIPSILLRPMVLYLNYNTRKKAREYGNVDYKKKAYLEERKTRNRVFILRIFSIKV